MKKTSLVLATAAILTFSSISVAHAGGKWPWFLPPLPAPPAVVIAPAPAPVPAARVYYYDGYENGRNWRESMRQAGYTDGYSDGYNLRGQSFGYDNRFYCQAYNRGWADGRDRRFSDDQTRRRRYSRYYDGGYDRHGGRHRCDDDD